MKKINVFCFPFAGGLASYFEKWKQFENINLKIIPVELPGRGRRFHEKLLNNLQETISDIYQMIEETIIDQDYVFFGHSMGGMICYELYHKILKHNLKPPLHIFISACKAPHYFNKRENIIHNLSDIEFISEVYDMGGCPKEFVENKDLQKYFIPILKSDFEKIETYYNKNFHKINVGLTVFAALKDKVVKIFEAKEWENYASKDFKFFQYQGDHFFVNESFKDIIRNISGQVINA